MYDTKKNTIILKNSLQEREITHELMHMCSTITTPDVTFTGFAQLCEKDYTQNIGLGLTEGYTTMITNKIFKQLPDYNSYAIEKDIAKRIENLV